MPILNVKLSVKPDAVITQQVANLLTDLTHQHLKKRREVIAVQVAYVPSEQWFINAESLTKTKGVSFSFDIKVTSGTNTKDEMRDYLAAVFLAMEGIFGKLETASYSVIHAVRADSWGFGGSTQEARYIEGGRHAL